MRRTGLSVKIQNKICIMKKRVLFILLIFSLLSVFPFISAELNATEINSGFACVNSKSEDCAALSLNDKIFSSLASGRCISQLESSMGSNGCFPSDACSIKTTSQAILSLKTSGRSTDKSVTWILSQPQVKSTTNIDWFLQIDANAATTCDIAYSGTTYQDIIINEDGTVANGAGSYLTVSSNGYWLLINPSIYGREISITCDQTFKTTELYQRQGYPTLYVSGSSDSASPGGTVKNSVNSSCFGTGTTCSYESSLWAALALDSAGKDISSYLPYLTVMADDLQNQQYLPYSFIYSLTSSPEFLEKLLSGQKTVNSQSYWDEGSVSGPYYDTALALLPLQTQSPAEKASALNWLSSTQGSDGCWNSGNLADTAFILYSVSGSRASSPVSTASCSTAGYHCLSSSSVCTQSGGSLLQSYTCSGAYVCCTVQIVLPTCTSQGGTICNSGQICQGGSPVTASDTPSGQICCLSGTCANPQPTTPSACELAGATCRNSCLDNEEAMGQSCDLSSQVCCSVKSGGRSGVAWIIILVTLILLTVLGIIFRKQLSVFWLKLKSKFGKGGKGASQMPPSFPPRGPPMTFQRRPPMPPPQRLPQRAKSPEVNDVLKRLKEIGK